MANTPSATIVVPTYQRPDELRACLGSLKAQTRRDYETIILKERGALATIRNQGLQKAKSKVVIFIDDDTICTPTWLSSILDTFQRYPSIVGVTGPAVIPFGYKYNRDLFKYSYIKSIYDELFLDFPNVPGRICPSGAFTTVASEETCNYSGPVHYLEACNMAFRKEALEEVGGFDEAYQGIGDWSEPDVCFRLRQRGYKLWFTPRAKLYHYPSKSGAYHLRKHTGARLSNYHLFAKRWVIPNWRHTLYVGFLHGYYGYKELMSWLH